MLDIKCHHQSSGAAQVPPCGTPAFFFTILSLAGGVNERAAQQAQRYVEERIAPVENEMKAQVSGIAVVVIVILIFFVLIPMLVYIVWIAYELKVSAGVMLALLLVFLIVSLSLVFLVLSVVSNTIDTVVNTATRQVVALDTPQAINALKASLNGSAAQYVLKTTGSASCLL